MNHGQVKVNVATDKLEARYSDFAIVSQNSLGFNFDFGQRLPNSSDIAIVARIALSPQHAKVFSRILSENVKKYEENFGEIKVKDKKVVEKNGNPQILHFK